MSGTTLAPLNIQKVLSIPRGGQIFLPRKFGLLTISHSGRRHSLLCLQSKLEELEGANVNNQIDLDSKHRTDNFRASERIRVKSLYSQKRHGLLGGFSSAAELVDWWMNRIDEQNGCCAYCKTSIGLISELIDAGLLKARRVNTDGKRGPCLELERKNADGGYSPENCALVCYYCNNDKSYVYSEDEYRRFFAPARTRHFQHLGQILLSQTTSDGKPGG
ncbi:hypothetical protein [Bradyrhizobium sp. SZCCHNR1051]|uniref:hypothetical protein n=1 Tax=Bradyrhizobium sp. SZCCHNR1051 TaxID=3057355 RepID=UPI002915EEB8|nr:hypothetical protein [Bradyrhizobium sp. SZCCHNR1051]